MWEGRICTPLEYVRRSDLYTSRVVILPRSRLRVSCKWVGRGQFRKTWPRARGINSPLSPQCKGLNFLIIIGEFDTYFRCHLAYCSCSLSGHLRSKDPNTNWEFGMPRPTYTRDHTRLPTSPLVRTCLLASTTVESLHAYRDHQHANKILFGSMN